jgi:hypothetical protein
VVQNSILILDGRRAARLSEQYSMFLGQPTSVRNIKG